jgi:hypothetical protein
LWDGYDDEPAAVSVCFLESLLNKNRSVLLSFLPIIIIIITYGEGDAEL